MEAVGTPAAGIAHDFNNILAIILGYTEMALEDVPADGAIGCNLQEVLSAGKRAGDLVRQILTFSRKDEQERRPVQLHTAVQERSSCCTPRSPRPSTEELELMLDNIIYY